jgi:prophage tail gpP-like protein
MPLNPDLRPDLRDLRVIVNTRWKNGYADLPIYSVESYYVDTALDNDADTWSVQLGDPRGELMELMTRDSEIRMKLFGVGNQGMIMTGIGDEASYSDGSWTITGRDYSSLATDSTVPPTHFRQVRAWAIVEQQAKQLGFRNTQLAHGKIVKKVQYTDGSESFWDFWWRLYRKEQMWIWCNPDATLIASTLNYSNSIDYYLGDFRDDDSTPIRRAHIPIESIEIRKTTQQRVGEVHVWWHKGDNGKRTIVKDPTTAGWIKRPIKVMLDIDAHSENAAKKTALEEIFEGKVGSVEFKVTIPDPGFPLRTNKIARVNLPDIGLFGQFFVVGARMQADSGGFVQEIRLREKQYAVTRRIPTDPKLKTKTPGPGVMASGLGAAIEGSVGELPAGWGDYYAKAAKTWHGPWDYQLFLATLLGITKKETGFQNERQNGGPGGDHNIWHPFKEVPEPSTNSVVSSVGHAVWEATHETLEGWKTKFANEKGDGYINWEAGVGPMQLTDRGLKNEADDLLRANFRNEFSGGRWHPQWNIWVGAKYLRECLAATVGDSGRDIDIWMGVSAYNKGPGGARLLDPYALTVKNYVFNDPGYLANVRSAVQEATAAATQPADPSSFDASVTFSRPSATKNSAADIATLKNIQVQDSSVDIEHVDWLLLVGLNKACGMLSLLGTITSGFRSRESQRKLWEGAPGNGLVRGKTVADWRGYGSNHMHGKAVDVEIIGRPIFYVIPANILKACGIHVPLGAGDPVHTTRIGVEG